jgi:hypothetical protein
MQFHRLAALRLALVSGVAGLALVGCATPRETATPATTVPTVAATDVSVAPVAALAADESATVDRERTRTEADERHGVVDGRAWTLVTTLRGSSLCMRLGWDDVTDQWESCYSTEYADLPLAWTNPTPPSGEHREMMFVVGLAPRATTHLQVVRGDTVVGEADAFEGGVLVPDRAGFAIPVVVESRDALLSPVTLPGDDLTAGVLLPLEVVAIDASGDELVRAGATTGSGTAMVCLDNGAPILEWSGACLGPEFPWPTVAYETGHLLVPASADAVTVELLRDGTVVASHPTVLVTPPAGESWPSLAIAGFVEPFTTEWYPYAVRSLDANGRVLATTPLFGGDGDGDGEIPASL